MDLFADIIVSLLPVMIVCRLAVSKSCTERSGVDIVIVRRPLGDLLENDCVQCLFARAQQQIMRLSSN